MRLRAHSPKSVPWEYDQLLLREVATAVLVCSSCGLDSESAGGITRYGSVVE